MRIMIFVAVFFVGLRDDAAGFELNLSLVEHQRMLIARPVLDRGEAKPIGSAILRLAMRGVAGRKVFIGIPTNEEGASFMGPFFVAETVEIVAEIPGDV